MKPDFFPKWFKSRSPAWAIIKLSSEDIDQIIKLWTDLNTRPRMERLWKKLHDFQNQLDKDLKIKNWAEVSSWELVASFEAYRFESFDLC